MAADHQQRPGRCGYDAELRRHNEVLRRACSIQFRDRSSRRVNGPRLDPAAAERAVGRLREALAAHTSDDGVWFNSRAWIVTARRR